MLSGKKKEEAENPKRVGVILYTNKMSKIQTALTQFKQNQTLTNVGELKNLGIGLKVLKDNKWVRLHEYTLPFDRFVLLYDDDLKPCDIGVY